jgi:hypothetical protein
VGAFERGFVARAANEMGIALQFGGHDRTVITASNAMEYAFEEGELADYPEVASRSSPPLWWKGWRPGRPTATRTARWDWMSCMSMSMTRWGTASHLVLLPGCTALPDWASVRRCEPARAGTGRRPRFTGVKDRRREAVVAGGDEAVLDHGTGFICGDVQAGISRSAWALTRVAIRRARHRSVGLAHLGERAIHVGRLRQCDACRIPPGLCC